MDPALEVRRTDLGPLDYLASGGMSMIYRAPGYAVPGIGEVVYKEFKRKVVDQAGPGLGLGMRGFVRFRERLEPAQRVQWDQRINWPLRVVVGDDGAATGILLPLIPARYFYPFRRLDGADEQHVREAQLLFGDERDMVRVGLGTFDLRTRLGVISKIASAFGMLHKMGVVFGDISGRNVVFDAASPVPAALLVDVDSARVRGTRAVMGAQPHTPHWEPPEALAAAGHLRSARRPGSGAMAHQVRGLQTTWSVQSMATDVYKFALMVVRILDYGRGRSAARDPARAVPLLRQISGPDAVDLLLASLGDDPRQRPTMRDWYDVLHGRTATRAGPHTITLPGHRSGPAATTTATAGTTTVDLTGLQDGEVRGNWTFVSGRGWVRRVGPTP